MKQKTLINTPIMVANTEWDLPENLIKDVQNERMINSLIDLVKPQTPEDLVGWAECVAYLIPAACKSPMRSDVSEIYLYCCYKLMESKGIKDIDFLDEFKQLSDYQMSRLKEFKLWIYKARGGKENNPFLSALKEVFFDNQNLETIQKPLF